MGLALTTIQNRRYDVIIIGGGINGASAAQNLAAAGYDCLVADKGDFGSGATGKSGRMLHIGLRFFEAKNPLRHFARHPGYFLNALRGARQAMRGVSEHMANAGKRIFQYRMCFPVYRDSDFKSWHLQAGLKLLSCLGDGRIALDHEVIKRNHAEKIPFFEDFRNAGELQAIACYNEFKFDWPERFCIDMLLDAQQHGAALFNYCIASVKKQDADGDWVVSLRDAVDEHISPVEVTAPIILNMAGTWADSVLPPSQHKKPLVHMTKGAHIVVKMPATYNGFGIAHINRYGEPFYVLPFHKNLFSVGVTETPFAGDASNVCCTDDEIDFLIEECNSLLPGRRLRRDDVVSSWAGVRPLTQSDGDPVGGRKRLLHDLTASGFPGIFALTGGPIMSHRSTGRLILDAVTARYPPPGTKGQPSYQPFEFSAADDSPAFLADEPEIRIADLELSVTQEYARTLTDVLLRRTSLAWRRRLTLSEAQSAAEIVAPLLHWSDEEQRAQVEQFIAYQKEAFRIPDTGCITG